MYKCMFEMSRLVCMVLLRFIYVRRIRYWYN